MPHNNSDSKISQECNKNKDTTKWHQDNPNKKEHINKEEPTNIQEETEETIDPEAICYIREMMEDRQNVNFIQTLNFTDEKVTDIIKTKRGDFWIKTKTNSKQVYWLADTGSPRSFMKTEMARNILVNEKRAIKFPEKLIGEFGCYKNNKINITGAIQVGIISGSSDAKRCTILLVDNNTINIMGKDVMDQLELHLTMAKQEGKGENNLYNTSNIHQKRSKWMFTKYPHFCRSKNHLKKLILKKEFNPTQHKRRPIPLHLTEKMEKDLNKTNRRETNQETNG